MIKPGKTLKVAAVVLVALAIPAVISAVKGEQKEPYIDPGHQEVNHQLGIARESLNEVKKILATYKGLTEEYRELHEIEE